MARQFSNIPYTRWFVLRWNVGATCLKAYGLAPGNLMGYLLVPQFCSVRPTDGPLHPNSFVWVAVIAMTSLMLRLGYNRAME